MRINVSLKYLEKNALIDDIIDKNLAKIERRVLLYRNNDPIHVSVHIEKNPHKEQYYCKTHVYLPARVLHTDGRGATIAVAVRIAFSALARQLTKVKSRVEKHLRKRCCKRASQIEQEAAESE